MAHRMEGSAERDVWCGVLRGGPGLSAGCGAVFGMLPTQGRLATGSSGSACCIRCGVCQPSRTRSARRRRRGAPRQANGRKLPRVRTAHPPWRRWRNPGPCSYCVCAQAGSGPREFVAGHGLCHRGWADHKPTETHEPTRVCTETNVSQQCGAPVRRARLVPPDAARVLFLADTFMRVEVGRGWPAAVGPSVHPSAGPRRHGRP